MTTVQERKRELIGKIEEAKRRFMEEIEPYLKELGDIYAYEPPPPIVLPDGSTFQYSRTFQRVGLLPEWEDKPE
jgi:hypothetical protein